MKYPGLINKNEDTKDKISHILLNTMWCWIAFLSKTKWYQWIYLIWNSKCQLNIFLTELFGWLWPDIKYMTKIIDNNYYNKYLFYVINANPIQSKKKKKYSFFMTNLCNVSFCLKFRIKINYFKVHTIVTCI